MTIQLTPEQAAEFQRTLSEELRAAWQDLRTAHPDDAVYGFGIYTGDDARTLAVVAFTDAGLATAVARYVDNNDGDADSTPRMLRWSPADSPSIRDGDDLLPRSQALRDAMPDPFADDDDLDDDDFDDEAPDLVAKAVVAAAFAALKSLDAEFCFGSGAERESLVLGLWRYDESDKAKVSAVRKLNRPKVVTRYKAELEAAFAAYEAWSGRRIAAMMKEKAARKAVRK